MVLALACAFVDFAILAKTPRRVVNRQRKKGSFNALVACEIFRFRFVESWDSILSVLLSSVTSLLMLSLRISGTV